VGVGAAGVACAPGFVAAGVACAAGLVAAGVAAPRSTGAVAATAGGEAMNMAMALAAATGPAASQA
jgi:hypothetical protein